LRLIVLAIIREHALIDRLLTSDKQTLFSG
jgi:hypothetical protein